jgi:hypothetical protein
MDENCHVGPDRRAIKTVTDLVSEIDADLIRQRIREISPPGLIHPSLKLSQDRAERPHAAWLRSLRRFDDDDPDPRGSPPNRRLDLGRHHVESAIIVTSVEAKNRIGQPGSDRLVNELGGKEISQLLSIGLTEFPFDRFEDLNAERSPNAYRQRLLASQVEAVMLLL